ncbi:carboxypeptidase M32 [Wenxinia saemankumensis]|uniref:Metal-dependent carboxypeptidase n=1 Tax=Wenxinia saemankumensis TaxID=1447782 RepID=A0A1M6B3Y4_9RHOB|nr:carboxypeptidase M32 [Wenxinia saemankumensis]SHI43462.1 carboxypeptidase Taq [Wenxinia saemankumensis]
MSYAAFRAEIGRINDLLCVMNLADWDSRVTMPPGGTDARADQMATLTGLARGMATGDALARAIDGAKDELHDGDPRLAEVEQAERERAILTAVPAEITEEMAGLKARAHAAWAEARASSDFAAYAPVLRRMMELNRRIAEAIGHDGHPYDAMVSRFEPGMTWARLQEVYTALKDGIAPLLDKALAAEPARADILTRPFPVAQQRAFGLSMAQRMGYDMARGRLDDTAHPFEISQTRGDVRITSRFRDEWHPGGTFAMWHEVGHAMYEQNIAPEHTRTIWATDLVNLYAVGGASFGMHEAQSRMWENRVGRSERFWELHFDELKAAFPDQLADVSARDYWRAVNAPRPDFIRVEADELTYDLHIILRSGIEADLVAGDLDVADLPGVWNERFRDLLGLAVPDDTRGCLQDVHWAHGYLGSFPTYTLGNIMSSQLFAAAQDAPGVTDGLEAGDYAPLFDFMAANVWAHGRSSSPDRTLRRVTGGPLDPAPYLADLTAKVESFAA